MQRRGPIVESEQNTADIVLVVLGFLRNESRIPSDQRGGVGDMPDVARLWGQDLGRSTGPCAVVRVNGCRGRRQNGEGEGGEDRGEELHRQSLVKGVHE